MAPGLRGKGGGARAFRTPEDFRRWLEKNHASARELIVRCFKVHAKHRGIGYKEALDEALCFGWIDGVRRSLDADSFTQRFTPRRARSNWSRVNIKRAHELEKQGRMHRAGLAAFHSRSAIADAPYSFENRHVTMDRTYEKRIRSDRRAWEYWNSQPPWYRRNLTFYVMSAKRPETREKRFAELLGRATGGRTAPPATRRK